MKESIERDQEMSKVSCRECYFIKVKGQNVNDIIEKAQSAVKEFGIPPKYHINVYQNVYACCGVSGVGLIIEITGPEEKEIRSIDLKAVAKIMEICEKEGLEHHSFEPLDIVSK